MLNRFPNGMYIIKLPCVLLDSAGKAVLIAGNLDFMPGFGSFYKPEFY